MLQFVLLNFGLGAAACNIVSVCCVRYCIAPKPYLLAMVLNRLMCVKVIDCAAVTKKLE